MANRMTWRRISQMFAAGLSHMTCTDHAEPDADCPFCADTAAFQLFEMKRNGQVRVEWETVATRLARRFRHFAECQAHSVADADPENCPFCSDHETWRQYRDFCRRRNVDPIERGDELFPRDAQLVSIDEIVRAQT